MLVTSETWLFPKAGFFVEQLSVLGKGLNEHLRFGEGENDFPRVLSALQKIGYAGGVNVELSRHSHIAPEMMRESFAFLQAILSELNSG